MTPPPTGTVRDWLDSRAATDAIAYQFFDDVETTLTWSALRDAARETAKDLTARGIKKGESVAIVMPNGSAAITAIFGALYGGFRATLINLVAGDEAISYALSHSEACAALVDETQNETFNRCKSDIKIHIAHELQIVSNDTLHPVDANDDALLMYTSGTTGRPKGVVHSHASLLAGGWTTQTAHALTPHDCGLCVLPIYHINALCVSMMGALVSGSKIAMAPKFSASRFWDQIAASGATWFSIVPTIVSHLLHSPYDPDDASKARLRFGRSASSALSPDVHQAFEDRFGVCLIETMGLTETAAQILSNPLPPKPRKIGSPGVGFGNAVCILMPDGTKAAAGTQGEIAVRGPNVMRGYLKNPDATKSTFAGDWLLTGDLGHMDADGYVFVTGRLKELIIKGGENIAPREVDEALYSHADVIEAAAFSRPCNVYGERVEAAVVLRQGSNLSTASLIAICQDKLGAFKSPDRVFVLNELPKGPSGKIQRLKIAERTGH